MIIKEKVWQVKNSDPLLAYILSREMNISGVLARLLLNRGIYTVEEAQKFLRADLADLYSPFLLADMDRAVHRILLALQRNEKILIYGDYDTDGITGTALLVKVLRRLGSRVDYYIPHRLNEGYGLHEQAVKKASEAGFSLLITVDCGISGATAVAWANEHGGPDIIVTDHHQVAETLPPAMAVINPKRPDCAYPFKELAGVGVALKLAQALLEAAGVKDSWQEYLDLTCLGTVADVVPLLGENRIFVKHGLPLLAGATSPGLQALLAVTGIKEVNTRDISFALAPRLNAAGRVEDAGMAVELLLTDNPSQAWQIAEYLDKTNQKRQEMEARVLDEALEILNRDPLLASRRVLVLASPQWHPGVTGIVASRLVDIFYRPVFLVALSGDLGKGSARSIPGFHLYQALVSCRQFLLNYGGHAQAAGFSLRSDQLENFSLMINCYAEKVLSEELLVPRVEVEAVVSLREVTVKLASELQMLSPFGNGNPEPMLGCYRATVVYSREVGREGNHLKLLVQENGTTQNAIGFHLASQLTESKLVDLLFTPVLDRWNDQVHVELELKEIREASEQVTGSIRQRCYLRGVGVSGQTTSGRGCQPFLDSLYEAALGPLTACDEVMFLPEFAWRWFNEYRHFPGKSFLPDWCFFCPQTCRRQGAKEREVACTCEISCPLGMEPEERGVLGFQLVDCRCPVDRTAQILHLILHLIETGQRTVVVVNSPYQTIEMAAYLRHLNGGGIAFCHYQLSLAEQQAIFYFFVQGVIKVVVTTASFVPALTRSGAEQIIVYHLPYDQRELNLILNGAAGGVYFFFSQEDIKKMNLYLAALAPDRDCLARLYVLLQRFTASGEQTNNKALVEVLKQSGLYWVKDYTVGVGLAILSELGLVENRHDDKIILSPAPKEKLQLEESITFRYGQKTKQQALVWQKEALKNPVEEVVKGMT